MQKAVFLRTINGHVVFVDGPQAEPPVPANKLAAQLARKAEGLADVPVEDSSLLDPCIDQYWLGVPAVNEFAEYKARLGENE